MLTLREKHRHDAAIAQLKANIAQLKLELSNANRIRTRQKSKIEILQSKVISLTSKLSKFKDVVKAVRLSMKGV